MDGKEATKERRDLKEKRGGNGEVRRNGGVGKGRVEQKGRKGSGQEEEGRKVRGKGKEEREEGDKVQLFFHIFCFNGILTHN